MFRLSTVTLSTSGVSLFATGAIVLSCGFLSAAAAKNGTTNSITGNTIYRLAGNGDTLWMITGNGLNYTIVSSGSLRWWGYETKNIISYRFYGATHTPMAFGDGTAMAAYFVEDPSVVSHGLWFYSHTSGQFGSAQLPWDKSRINAAISAAMRDSLSFSFDPIDIAWTPGSFWIACSYGGLVRVRTADLSAGSKLLRASVYYPQVNFGIPVEQFPSERLDGYPDSNNQVLGVAAWSDSAGLPIVVVLTPTRVWTFSVSDTTWDTLPRTLETTAGVPEKQHSIRRFVRIYANADPTQRALYAGIDTTLADDTTVSAIYRYESPAARWRPVGSGLISTIAFGDYDTIYVVQTGVLAAMRTGDTLVRLSDYSIRLNERMVSADPAVMRPAVNDILFLRGATSASLWLATDDGLYYSLDERLYAKSGIAFNRASRAPKLASGLRTAYFVPTILTPDVPEGYFAYNLSKKAPVTISIYDWNLDFVKTVVDRQVRESGSSRPDGRSTVKKLDVWDGTDREGKPVAPGIYYFKIRSGEGEQAMGKIIVAR